MRCFMDKMVNRFMNKLFARRTLNLYSILAIVLVFPYILLFVGSEIGFIKFDIQAYTAESKWLLFFCSIVMLVAALLVLFKKKVGVIVTLVLSFIYTVSILIDLYHELVSTIFVPWVSFGFNFILLLIQIIVLIVSLTILKESHQ